jgi:phosphopantetheinyl transferase
MRIYYTDIRGVSEALAKYPPTGESRGSALGMSLLAAAYEQMAGSPVPRVIRIFGKKPVFDQEKGLCFSISHSRSHVLCALSETPVGADTLDFRALRPKIVERLASARELEDFSFYELWALRESLYKLSGEGDLRTMRFIREDGRIVGPDPKACHRLYRDVENSSCAVSSYVDDFPDHLIRIPVESLLKKPSLLD